MRGDIWGRRLQNISLSLFLLMPDSCKAYSMSQLWPFLQAVCQKGRGSLEWDREVALEREHLSQGNKRKARAKQRNRIGEPRWWTMFPICTHLHHKRQRSGHQFHQLAGEWSSKPPREEAGGNGSGGNSKAGCRRDWSVNVLGMPGFHFSVVAHHCHDLWYQSTGRHY